MPTSKPTPLTRRIDQWLHTHGIAHVNNSVLGGGHPGIRVNVQGRPLTPRWLAVRAGHRYFLHTHSLAASSHHLTHITTRQPAADGTRRWTLHYQPTRPA